MAERLDFRKLRYVVAVAQVHSLTGAAKLLSISQPALTRCIAEVEDELGFQIFVRQPRGVTVTAEGERFVQRAEVLLSDLEALSQDFQPGAQGARKRLRVGVAPGTYLPLAAGTLSQFAQAHPDVDIATAAGLPQEIFPRLETGEVDLVLTTSSHLRRWPETPSEDLAPLQVAYLVRKGHPAEGTKRFTREDVLRYPAILAATSDWLELDMAEMHEKQGLPPLQATYVTDDFTLVFALLNQTDAYWPIVTTAKALRDLTEQFSLVSSGRPFAQHSLCVAYARTRAVSSPVRALVEMMKESFAE